MIPGRHIRESLPYDPAFQLAKLALAEMRCMGEVRPALGFPDQLDAIREVEL